MSDIDVKYAALGGPAGWLGPATTAELVAPDGMGHYRHFRSGSIYWTAQSGAHEVHGRIRDRWAALGWERSVLRYPATDETGTPAGGGRYNHFQGGSIYWTAATDSHEVHGAIRDKWASLGWERSVLGFPLTDESTTPDGIGRYNHFQAGSVYWTPTTGAHEVHGAIRAKWSALGWEKSIVGYPTTDEMTAPDGVGRYSHFQSGSIYWTPATGAHEVHGAIRTLWATMAWERSFLGYPTSDELVTEDGIGRYSEFQHGSIYWSPATGALACRETVRLHVKCLVAPTRFSVNQMISNMRLTYATAQVGIRYASFETLNLPALEDLDVGACTSGSTTQEQVDLFSHRNDVVGNDVVAYFVRSTNPPYNGCASHPNNRPGAAIASGASAWTMAHELGHVLGLQHVNDNNRLMTGNGTDNITNPPPDLVASESATMLASNSTS